MQTQIIIDLQNGLWLMPQLRPRAMISIVAMRHDHIQAVVAARKLHHDKDFGVLAVGLLQARSILGISERKNSLIQERRDCRRDSQKRQTLSEVTSWRGDILLHSSLFCDTCSPTVIKDMGEPPMPQLTELKVRHRHNQLNHIAHRRLVQLLADGVEKHLLFRFLDWPLDHAVEPRVDNLLRRSV